MSVRQALLGLLAGGARHGYELRAAYEGRLVPQGRLNIGQVYTTLERLERDGLVQHERVVGTDGHGRDRKVYALTPEGHAELHTWLAEPSPVRLDLRNEVFLKIVLARRIEGVDARGVVDRERRAAFERLHEVTQARARAEDASLEDDLLLDLAALRLQAFLKWLDHCEEKLS